MYSAGLLLACRSRCSVTLQRLHQLAPATALALQLGHAAERTGVRRIDAQCLLHRVDRVLEVAQVLRVPAADLDPEVRRRAAVLALELVHAVGVLVEQLLPTVGRRGEALELVRGLVVRVVALERGLEHVERALLIADLALVDLGDLVEDARSARRSCRVAPSARAESRRARSTCTAGDRSLRGDPIAVAFAGSLARTRS